MDCIVYKKIVMLDIDGVLNSAIWDRQRVRGQGPASNFDPAAVARLNRLTNATGAQIVVSSSWRQYGEEWVTKALRSAGVTAHIIGVTPILDNGADFTVWVPRGREIQAWLSEHPTEAYVVLDDDDDMDGVRHRFVRTVHEVGLTDDDVELAVMVLERQRLAVLEA